MTTDPSSLRSGEEPTGATAPEPGLLPNGGAPRMTRASAVWVATAAALILLVRRYPDTLDRLASLGATA